MEIQQGFKKNERLKSKKSIERLFEHNQHVFQYPIKAYFLHEPYEPDSRFAIGERDHHLPKIGLSVSKKKFKRAVDRNLVRRRLIEAYRTSNVAFKKICIEKSLALRIMFVYITQEQVELPQLQKSMEKVLKKVLEAELAKR